MTPVDRISYDELPDDLREQLRPRYERLGYLGEFFQLGAHQPAALGHFVGFTEALKNALSPRLVEPIALTVATITGNDYERVQHERLALKVGLDEEEVTALVERSAPQSGRFSPAELAAIDLAVAVVDARGRGCTAEFERLLELVGSEVAVGALMTAVRYLAHATMSNTWELGPPVSSPLERSSAGA